MKRSIRIIRVCDTVSADIRKPVNMGEGTMISDRRIDCLLLRVWRDQAPWTPGPGSPAPDISPGEILPRVPRESAERCPLTIFLEVGPNPLSHGRVDAQAGWMQDT